jgi:lipopolysaccharide/colanic/teichoic acid biosynthesis glycosyltransferase
MTAETLGGPWRVLPNREMLSQAADVPPPAYAASFAWRVKRWIDLAVSATALVLLSPLIAGISLAVAIGSPGPVFFRQERVTARGRRYWCLKFRTMRTNVDQSPHLRLLDQLIAGEAPTGPTSAPRFKLASDNRTTAIGRWLRRTSLDELPQLWNVFVGDISLIGPQAPLAFEVERYRPEWLERLAVPAGLTGPWQVMGRGRVPYARMIELDLDYVRNWSLRRDLRLVALTLPAVLLARGAR